MEFLRYFFVLTFLGKLFPVVFAEVLTSVFFTTVCLAGFLIFDCGISVPFTVGIWVVATLSCRFFFFESAVVALSS